MFLKSVREINASIAVKFLFFASVFCLIAGIARADSYEDKVHADPFYQTILDVAKTTKGREMLDFLDGKLQEDARHVHAISLWLRDNSINQKDPKKINSLYFLSYSDTLSTIAASYKDAGDPEQYRELMASSVLNLYIFELMASIDAARCQDPTALQAITKGMVLPRVNDLGRPVFAMFPRERFDDLEKTALLMEEKTTARPPNVDICSLGQARLRDLAAAPGVQQKEIPDSRYAGGTRTELIPPAGYSFVPAMVPDSEWLVTRNKLLSVVTSGWAKRYDAFAR